jgi:hypothetical protein
MCMPIIFLDWAHQLMYVHDQLLIVRSSSGMLAMLGIGSGPSKLWQKLWCCDGFTAIRGGIAAMLIIARPLVSLRLAKKPILKAKMLY